MNSSCCIILARGGSKRIPRKNVRNFCGLPMVAWPVQHAVKTHLFSEVVISTDDKDIAVTARRYGASFFSLRPEALSNDFASTVDVLQYELAKIQKRTGTLPAFCCCLYGTSVFASPLILQQAYEKIADSDCELLMALVEYSHPIERALQISDSGEAVYRQPAFVASRTQDIKPSYHDSAMFYFFRTQAFFDSGASFLAMKKAAIVVPKSAVVDIDTEEDWRLAELIYDGYLRRDKEFR